MQVIDCRGRQELAAFAEALQYFRYCAADTNIAVHRVCNSVFVCEHPDSFVNGKPDAEWWEAFYRHFAKEVCTSLLCVRKAKQALLDMLAYIDGAKPAAPVPSPVIDCSGAQLEQRRAAVNSLAIKLCKGMQNGILSIAGVRACSFDPEQAVRLSAALDELELSVKAAAKQWLKKEDPEK